MIPFRLAVQTALTEALREITPANGYNLDLSNSVFRGRDMYGDNDTLPLLGILEDVRPEDALDAPAFSTAYVGSYNLLIQGFVDDNFEHPTDQAFLMRADVKRRLALAKKQRIGREGDSNILGLGRGSNRITGMKIGTGFVRPADGQTSDTAHFWLTLSFDISEDDENPFV